MIKDLGVRVGVMLMAILCSLWIVMCVAERSNAKPVPDESDHDLVTRYIFLPCDAMEDSYKFMYNKIQIVAEEYDACMAAAKQTTYKYPGLMCVWINQDFQFWYVNIKSLDKAYQLMCGEDGQRRQKETEIDFPPSRPHQ